MTDEPTAARGNLPDRIADRYGPEAGEQMRKLTDRLDAHDNAERRWTRRPLARCRVI